MKHARSDYNERIQDSAGIIPDDEPVFLLRASDIAAPTALRVWIESATRHGASGTIIEAAATQLAAFEAWHNTNGAKVPDMPESAVIAPPEGNAAEGEGTASTGAEPSTGEAENGSTAASASPTTDSGSSTASPSEGSAEAPAQPDGGEPEAA